jgi:hypothetical protein
MRPAQIAERTVTLAEIVEHQPDAERAQPFERGQGGSVIPQEDAFRDFELQPARLKPA